MMSGLLKLILDTRPQIKFGYDDFDFNINNLRINPATFKPDYDYDNGEYLFDASTTETVIGTKITKHEFKVGNGVAGSNTWYPHVHWVQSDSGNVVWGLQYKMWQASDLEPEWSSVIKTTAKDFTYTSGAIHQISPFTPIDMGLITSTAVHVKVRVSRIGNDALDTYTGDARFLGFDFHVPINQIFGSRQEYIK